MTKPFDESKHKRQKGKFAPEQDDGFGRRAAIVAGVVGAGILARKVGNWQQRRDFMSRVAKPLQGMGGKYDRNSEMLGLRHLGRAKFRDVVAHAKDVFTDPTAVGKTPSRKELRRQFTRDSFRQRERVIVTDKDGKVAVNSLGDATGVGINRHQSNAIQDMLVGGRFGRTFHNHPGLDLPPSPQDWVTQRKFNQGSRDFYHGDIQPAVVYGTSGGKGGKLRTSVFHHGHDDGRFGESRENLSHQQLRDAAKAGAVRYKSRFIEKLEKREIPWTGAFKHANPGRQALSGVKNIALAAPRAARWAHKHPLVTAGAMVGAYMAHKMMKQPYRSTEEGENPVEIVKLEGDLVTPAQRLAKLRLEKAYDESRVRRDQSGRFSSTGRSSIEREKPSIERSSLLAGGIEGWKALDAVSGISLTGAAARAVNRARFGSKEGKGSYERNVTANALRQAPGRRAQIKQGAKLMREMGDGDVSAVKGIQGAVGHHMDTLVAHAAEHFNLGTALPGVIRRNALPIVAGSALLGAASAHRRGQEHEGSDIPLWLHVAGTGGDIVRLAGATGLATAAPTAVVNAVKHVIALSGSPIPHAVEWAGRHSRQVGLATGAIAAGYGLRDLYREHKARIEG